MQVSTVATVGLSLLFLSVRADAQQWSVDLYDIAIDDPTVDQVRAESVEFMPDGKTLVTAGYFYDGKTRTSVGDVRLRSTMDGSVTVTLRGTALTYALRSGSLAVSPSGERIAAAGRKGDNQRIVDVFDSTAMKYAHSLTGDPSPTTCLVFSPDGMTLAAAHMNGTIDLWNHGTGKLGSSFLSHVDGVWPIAFSRDGKLLATGNGDGSVTFRDSKGGKELGHIPAQPELSALGSVVFSPDGTLLAIGGFPNREGNSPIDLWELPVANKNDKKVTAKLKASFRGHHDHTYSLAFSPDGTLLASANQDTTVRIWDLHTNNHLQPITQHKDFVYDVAFSPNGTMLATLGRDSLKLWTIKELRAAQ